MIAFKPLQIIENINNGGDVGFDFFFLFFFSILPVNLLFLHQPNTMYVD